MRECKYTADKPLSYEDGNEEVNADYFFNQWIKLKEDGGGNMLYAIIERQSDGQVKLAYPHEIKFSYPGEETV